MSVILIAAYFSTYCIAFAGIGILNFMKGQLRFLTLRVYFPFLIAYLAYVLVKNSAFFISVFLHRSGYLAGGWYALLDCLSTSALLLSYQYFYLNLSKDPRFKRIPGPIRLLPFLPLVLAFAWLCSEAAAGPRPELRRALLIADSIDFFLVFAISSGFLRSWRKHSVPASGNFIFRFLCVGNLAFLPIFAAQAMYNQGPLGPLAPLSAENLYFAVLNVVTIGVLAKRVFSTRAVRGRGDGEELGLSFMELEIVTRIRRGLTNKAIAYHLGVSEHVVKNCVHQILRKTNTRNRVELLRALDAKTPGCIGPGEPGPFEPEPSLQFKALGVS